MSYKSTWWYPNYVEYGTGLNQPKRWPDVQEQYRRPEYHTELRHYDVPCEGTSDRLYYEMPRLGRPQYRATFRDKPFTVARHYPGEDPHGKPVGFYGRVYYEDGPPAFKYQGPKKDELYWLERAPYLPSFPKTSTLPVGPPNERDNGLRDTNMSAQELKEKSRSVNGMTMSGTPGKPASLPGSAAPRSAGSGLRSSAPGRSVYVPNADAQTIYTSSYTNPAKRMTQDGVGFL